MSAELKPCPFCGAQPKMHKKSLDERFAYADEVTLQCPSCGCARSAVGDTSKPGYADNSTTEQRAIAAWNRRPAQLVPATEREPIPSDEVLSKLWTRAGKEGSAAWGKDESVTNRHTWQLRKFAEFIAAQATQAERAQVEQKEAAPCNLRYDMYSAHLAGEKRGPREVMRELGIDYEHATPQSICDQWWFWNCSNVPKVLPDFLSSLDMKPHKAIGFGLSREEADKLDPRSCAEGGNIAKEPSNFNYRAPIYYR